MSKQASYSNFKIHDLIRDIEGDYYLILNASPGQYNMGTIWYGYKCNVKATGEVEVSSNRKKGFDTLNPKAIEGTEFICVVKPTYFVDPAKTAEKLKTEKEVRFQKALEKLTPEDRAVLGLQ